MTPSLTALLALREAAPVELEYFSSSAGRFYEAAHEAVPGLVDQVAKLTRERDEAIQYMTSDQIEYGKLVASQRERMDAMAKLIDRQQLQIADDSRALAAITKARDEACRILEGCINELLEHEDDPEMLDGHRSVLAQLKAVGQ